MVIGLEISLKIEATRREKKKQFEVAQLKKLPDATTLQDVQDRSHYLHQRLPSCLVECGALQPSNPCTMVGICKCDKALSFAAK